MRPQGRQAAVSSAETLPRARGARALMQDGDCSDGSVHEADNDGRGAVALTTYSLNDVVTFDNLVQDGVQNLGDKRKQPPPAQHVECFSNVARHVLGSSSRTGA